MTTKFSARDQTLGYLFQARYALYLTLSRSEEHELLLESLDDIEFEEQGTPRELLQLKHHSTPSSLTDASPELWKTIRIWSENILNEKIDPFLTTFTLITTATSSESSIAMKLRPSENRDTTLALEELITVAKSSSNAALARAFEAFIKLEQSKRESLVNSMYVLDNSPNIQDTSELIKNIIRNAVAREHRDGLFERLEGWWFGKVVLHLNSDIPEAISGFEVNDNLRSIAEQFLPKALPIDFLDAQPDEVNPEGDNRQFVMQLKMIAVQNPRIEKAIIDYYRAFEQRSKWVRESLLIGGEIEKYETRLIDEWQRYKFAIIDEKIDENSSETEFKRIGKDVLTWMELTADYKIRPNVTEPYVMRGSYHILADSDPPRVWWHPKFIERLAELLSDIKK